MPATRIQIVVDCQDADRMVDFWSAATGYEPEDVDAFVRGMLDAGHATADLVVETPRGLRWKGFGSLRHPDDGVTERGTGEGRRILFQEVPEPKSTKDRIHLDLLVGPDRREAEVERLVGLGASVLDDIEEHGGHHTVMADPEGNEFCVA